LKKTLIGVFAVILCWFCPGFLYAQTGACCLPNNTGCVMASQAYCQALGGLGFSWDGAASCATSSCGGMSPVGACCSAIGECIISFEADCPYEWLGNNSLCSVQSCYQTQPIQPPGVPNWPLADRGACCYQDQDDEYQCVITYGSTACFALQQGASYSSGQTCNPLLCVPTTYLGACCVGTWCQLLSDEECAASEGTYGGTLSLCGPNTCLEGPPEPYLACCFGPLLCTVTTVSECLEEDGRVQWDVTSCSTGNLCPVATIGLGACCKETGCEVVTYEECQSPFWTPGGLCVPNVTCDGIVFE
jgi:hypothetical protein